MKKLITAILTLTMVFAMSLPAFAADTTIDQYTPEPKTGTSAIGFTVSPTYTVVIPEKIELEAKSDGSGYAKSYGVKLTNLLLTQGTVLTVSVDSDDFQLDAGSAYKLDYTITPFDRQTGVIGSFTANETDRECTLTILIEAPVPAYAGDYSDIVTFTVSVDGEHDEEPVVLNAADIAGNMDLTPYIVDGKLTVAGPLNEDDLAKLSALIKAYPTAVTLDLSATSGYTELPDSWFFANDKLAGIILPSCVTAIGDFAFADSTSLTTVTAPEVSELCFAAFQGCTNLVTFTAPKAVTIDQCAFRSCGNLTTVNLPSAETIDGLAFQNCTNLTMPKLPKVTTIGDEAFAYWMNSQTIYLPQTTIDYYQTGEGASVGAFEFCDADIEDIANAPVE